MLQRILNKMLMHVKIFKLAKVLKINPRFFFDLIIFHLSKLFRGNVDDKLIVLGGASGKAFMGNTKYLYYYLRDNTDYKILYYVKSYELKQKLERNGINTIYAYSLEAIKILRKARAVFVTHGYIDVLPIKFSSRTIFVQTWHGADIKILNSSPYFNKYIYSKWTKIFRLKLRNHELYDYVLNPSGEKKPLQILSNAFKYPIERIITTGYPRNDIFFSKDPYLSQKLKKKYGISNSIKTIVLYAPTFREKFSTKNPFSMEAQHKLNELGKKLKTIFLMKTHISESLIKIEESSNIKSIRKDDDIQELLFITDLLITDYSSVFCDFLLLNRPIILYVYDYEEYINNRGIYYDSLEDITPGPIFYSSEDLLNAIENIEEYYQKYESKHEKIKKYFNKYKDGKSSERLLRFLKLI